jgi:hypothetical protein
MLFDLIVPDDVVPTMQFENGSAPEGRKEGGRFITDPQTFGAFEGYPGRP